MNFLKYLFNWKHRYFVKKMRAVNKMILDLEFKRFKTREIREDVRMDYDGLRSNLMNLENQIEREKVNPTMEKDEANRLNDDKAKIEKEIEKRKEQMKALDLEVEGSKPTPEYPEGVQGINDQLDALHELVGMIKSYFKEL